MKLTYIDSPNSDYTTAFLGKVEAGRIFYGENSIRYMAFISCGCFNSVQRVRQKGPKGVETAKLAIEDVVGAWCLKAGLVQREGS